jgi:hypothetical protein
LTLFTARKIVLRNLGKVNKTLLSCLFIVGRVSSRKLFWVALTIVMFVCLDLVIARFLLDKLPVLAAIMIVMISIASLAAVPSPDTKRAYKTIFLATLVVSSGFTIGVYAGLFNSMILLDDSWVDISHSAIIFHLKNNGFIYWTIKEVKVSNITFTLKYSGSLKENLQAGDTAYLIVYYCENIFQWIPSTYAARINWDPADPFSPWYPMDISCPAKGEISPSTFQNESTYRVVFTTNGVLKHSFAVEAKFTLDEKLNITARKWLSENSREIWVRFNNTGEYYSYIYTIQVANVTFYFKPPMKVPPCGEMRLFFAGGEGLFGWGAHYYGNVYATPTPKFPMLEVGTTYEILVRTMTNNLYITNVTI